MAPSFRHEGNDWYCNAGLPSDITILLDGVSFHLHKFPLISRCGKVAKACDRNELSMLELKDFPGGAETFIAAAKFCYGMRVEMSPRTVLKLHSAASYLEMTSEFGDDNLLSKCETFLHRDILSNWKHCIAVLMTADPDDRFADKLPVVGKCLNAISGMSCTDRSLFGWPMMIYGTSQSPLGSILWNGVPTGARVPTTASDWWFEDVSGLSLHLFGRLMKLMQRRGIREENLLNAVIYYSVKHLPGLSRWMGKKQPPRCFPVDERVFIESIVKILPAKKGKFCCRFLLGVLRVGLIVGAGRNCLDLLEERIGRQLEEATLDGLLIPNFSDCDTLYDVDCVERMIRHFLSSDFEANQAEKVAKLVDNFMAEIASDRNLKSRRIRSLAELLPDSSRTLHDGLYRVIDIYLKEHPWLSEKEKEHLCNVVDYQKLSMEACEHASQNERLPLRATFQVLFFEQMQFRIAIAGCLRSSDGELPGNFARENQDLRHEMEDLNSRVCKVEAEFGKVKEGMRKVRRSYSFVSSPRFLSICRLLPSEEGGESLIHRKSFSLF